MANKGGRPRGTNEIAPKIRAYFMRAINGLQKKHGKTLDELIMEGLVDDLKGTLSALSKYIPAEVEVKLDDQRANELTDTELADIAAASSDRVTEKTGSQEEPESIH